MRRLARLLGEEHPLTLAAAANLTLDLRSVGDGDEAEQLQQSTIEGFARTLGLGHPDPEAFLAGRRLDFDFDSPPI